MTRQFVETLLASQDVPTQTLQQAAETEIPKAAKASMLQRILLWALALIVLLVVIEAFILFLM